MQFIEDHERSPRAWYGGAVGLHRLRRQPEHRPHPAHDPRQGRRRRGARRRDAALRLRPRRGGARDRAQGLGVARRHPRGRAASHGRGRRRGAAAGRRASACCWSTTRTRSSTRSPTTSARPGAEVVDAARPASRATMLDERAARPGRAVARARARRRDFDVSGTLEALRRARAAGLRRLPRPAGDGRALRRRRSACSTTRCTARPSRIRVLGGRLFDGLPGGVHRRAATTRSSRSARRCRPRCA